MPDLTMGTPPNLAGLPALTVKQPWGAAIRHFGKDVENRTWAPPGGLTHFMVHAGAGRDPAGRQALLSRGISWDGDAAAGRDIRSAVVAVAELKAVCPGGPCRCGAWSLPGFRHWKLGKVWPLADPVACAGRQKLWYPTAAIRAAVQRELELGLPLTCTGRAWDAYAYGKPAAGTSGRVCGKVLDRSRLATQSEYETMARLGGWRFPPGSAYVGGVKPVMCPTCAAPTL